MIIGCGYLGQRLGALLLRDGGRVFGTVRSAGRAAEIAGLGIEPVIVDVLQPDSLRELPRVDRVFYCVGFDRAAGAAMRAVYVDGLQNVLDNLPASVGRIVYASSTGVYAQAGGEWVDEGSPTHPMHESGKVCLEAEGRIRAWSEARSISSAVVLRFAGLYGPGRIVRRAILERGEPIPGDPDKFLNMIHIEDAARVSAAALDAVEPDPIYTVGDDRPVTRREYYTVAARALGAPEPRFAPPLPGSPEAARDATNKRVANHRMKRGLGITLLYPDITTGLPAALDGS
ncbi:MAG: SDR family oxidoreductase [Isosphaeraceae bacterium]